jgi:hypothetical protein
VFLDAVVSGMAAALRLSTDMSAEDVYDLAKRRARKED